MKKNIFAFLLLASLSLFAAGPVFAATVDFGNPLSFSTIEAVLNNITTYLKSIAGVIAVIFIVIGGIMYMLSGGNKDMMERGKKTVIYALAGLAIVVGASTFLTEIKAVIGGGGSSGGLVQIANRVLSLLLSIVGFLAIIAIVIGAIWMFTGAGDEDRYELGKKTVVYAIIGTAIAVGSLIIAQQVSSLISGSG
jgi:type IV secretory pathway VirB2 component (pilin)